MLKTKLAIINNLSLKLLLMSICLVAFFLISPISSAEVCPPDRPACASTPTSPTCSDPTTLTTDIQRRSCACDKTLNLTTEDAVKSCEACQKSSSECLTSNVIIKDIQKIVNFLSALVAVVVIGSIMVGGIQYALGGDSAEKVGAAKKRIGNSLYAFLIFILTFAFLQWLIPGGVFS